MKQHCIRELDEYKKSDILRILKDEKAIEELSDYLIIDKEKDKYQFNYVGIIIYEDTVINCYPKYITNNENIFEDFKQVLRVIKKYKKFHEKIDYEKDILENNQFNILSLLIFFLEDYFENGVYTNYQNTLEIHGNGEIDWDKTINNTYPIIKNNRPYYLELYTKCKINDFFDYFRLLHEYVITECSKRLEDVGLLELFDLTSVNLSDKSIEDFGDDEAIVEKIDKELNVEFNSHKQELLKAMKAYFSLTNSFSNKDVLTGYGTSYYHRIWEVMLSKVLDNKLNKSLFELGLDSKKTKLKDVIKKPKWFLNEGKFETDTFQLDLVTFYNNEFIILDAKYYKLNFDDGKLTKQPGLTDVTKQYLYQLAYNDFINKYEFDGVKNAFLLPTDKNNIEKRGYVEIDILHDLELKNFKLENIQVIMVPAREVNRLFLNNGEMEFKEIWNVLKKSNKIKKIQ